MDETELARERGLVRREWRLRAFLEVLTAKMRGAGGQDCAHPQEIHFM